MASTARHIAGASSSTPTPPQRVVRVFSALFERVPPSAGRALEEWSGDNTAGLANDSTAAFNCRRPDQIDAPARESPHANGGVAGFPQHTRLRGRVAVLSDVLQHRGEDVDPRALVGRLVAERRGGVLIEGLTVGHGGRLLTHPRLPGSCWRVSSR